MKSASSRPRHCSGRRRSVSSRTNTSPGTTSAAATSWSANCMRRTTSFRSSAARSAQKPGMSVTLLPAGELFQALEKGVLDGTEFSLPTVDEQLGFYKVAKFYHLPGWHQPSTSQFLYVNTKEWAKLKPDTQAMIEGACTAGVTMAMAKAEATQAPVIEKFQKEGVKAVKLPDSVLRAFQKATDEVMAEESAKDPTFKKIYDSQKAFQKQH